ncbi:MAG: 50S ribosome-binding GTPase [Verrucomicrobiae bacterium]|nr:50S ribosome-binding GTPase [Verrucomicrobiae bacterium]MDW7980581.1 GTPase [Verrucomicrobiales bacterium]
MPANLTPEYEKAQQQFREAKTTEEQIAALERMLAVIPKHKGTEKLQADIKRRLSQLRRQEQKSPKRRGPDPFHIPRSGAGQVVLVGLPNTGKSSLLAAVTDANAKVADYPFTTTVPQPGMWFMADAQIELIDTPPITPGHVPGGLMGTIRNADVVAVVAEAGEAALDQTETVLSTLRERGLSIRSVPANEIDRADPSLRSGVIIASKADLAGPDTIEPLRELYSGTLDVIPVSVRTGAGLTELFRRLWELLAVIRVYSKEPGKPPDLDKPFILPVGSTVADLARRIHRELPERMRFARVWGHTRFEGQQVPKTELLRDRDVVEIHE